jgi:X-X-X-Leu-X-X-Gly heptad repeat protein
LPAPPTKRKKLAFAGTQEDCVDDLSGGAGDMTGDLSGGAGDLAGGAGDLAGGAGDLAGGAGDLTGSSGVRKCMECLAHTRRNKNLNRCVDRLKTRVQELKAKSKEDQVSSTFINSHASV